MKEAWRRARVDAATREHRRHKRAERDARPLQRLDPVLGWLVAAGAGAALMLGAALGLMADRSGRFDPPVLQALPDERILTNLRDSDQPIVDLASLPEENGWAVARSDGTVHHVVASAGLVSERDMFRGQNLLSDVRVLGAACASERSSATNCSDPGALVAVTAAGGLAWRPGDGPWRVLIGDAPWVGIDGNAVDQEDVVAWAASDDGRWVAVFANAGGVGLFDAITGSWVPVALADQALLTAPGSEVRHVQYAHGRFWIGGLLGGRGLYELIPSTPTPILQAVGSLGGEVVDLERTNDGDLLVIVRGACSGAGEGCTSVWRVDSGRIPTKLLGETEIHADLSDATLAYAVAQEQRVVAFGHAGIFVYDTALRSWTAITTESVTAHHVVAGGGTAFVATATTVHRLRGGRSETSWPVSGRPLTQLFVGADGVPYGLDQGGAVLRVEDGTTVSFADPALGRADGFVAIAVDERTALLTGPHGAAVIDVVGRRASWVPAEATPDSLKTATLRLFASNGAWWGVDMATGQVMVVSFEGAHPARTVRVTGIGKVAAPVRNASADSGGLHVVDAAGLAFGANTSSPRVFVPEVGDAPPSALEFVSFDAAGEDLLFATADGIWRYDLAARSWSAQVDGVPGKRIVELATGGVHADDGMSIVTDDGMAFVRTRSAWAALVGSGSSAPIGAGEVSDALEIGGNLWFGGEGRVFAYEKSANRIVEAWSGGRGTVTFLGASNGQPVWLSGAAVRVGGQVVSIGEVLDAWPAPSGYLTIVDDGDGPYLRSYTQSLGASDCFFYGRPAPRGDLVDARDIGGGRLLVVAGDATAIYEPTLRRWLRTTGPQFGPESRLYRLGRFLAAVTPSEVRLVEVASIGVPSSCDRRDVSVPWSAPIAARSVSVDETAGRLAMLHTDGRVVRWSDGAFTELLPAVTSGPQPNTIRRVGRTGDRLWMVTNDAMWFYDLSRRTWGSVPFANPQVWDEVDVVERDAGGYALTFWAGAGTWGTVVTPGQTRAELSVLSMRALPAFERRPDGLIDVSQEGRRWTFLFDDTSLDWDDSTGAWQATWSLPAASRDRRWTTVAGLRALVEGPTEAPSRLYLVIPGGTTTSTGAAPIASVAYRYDLGSDRAFAVAPGSGDLWRVDLGGALWRCRLIAGVSAPAGCAEVAAAPLDLAATAFNAAYAVGPTFVLVVNDRLHRLGPERRSLDELVGPVVMESGRWFASGGEAHFWEGPGGRLWLVGATGPPEMLLDGVLHLARIGETIAVAIESGVWVLEGRGVRRPSNAADVAAALAWTWDPALGFVAFDVEAGRPSTLVDAGAGPAVGPFPWPEDLAALLSGTATLSDRTEVEGWWYQRLDGRVNFVHSSTCFREEPPENEELPASDGAIDSTEVERDPEEPASAAPALVAYPCAETLFATELLVEDPLRAVERRGPSFVLVSDTTTFTIESGTVSSIGRSASHPWGEVPPLATATDQVRRAIQPRATRNELFPATIAIEAANRFTVFDGVASNTFAGAREAIPEPPLATPTLSWVRSAAAFRFGAAAGVESMLVPTEAIRDGRFLMTHGGRSAFQGPDRHTLLNAFGLWSVSRDGEVSWVKREAFPPAVGLAHGHYLLSEGRIHAAIGDVAPDALQHVEETQDLRFVETLRGGGVVGTLRVSGAARPAFATRGFAFDNRLDVAWEGSGVWVLTELGLMPTTTLTSVDAGPNAAQSPTALDYDSGALHALVDGAWFARRSGSWSASGTPGATWTMATEAERTWVRDESGARVEAPAAPWRAARSGLAFEADRLVSAAATPSTIVVVTGVGTLALDGVARLRAAVPPAAAAPGIGALDAARPEPGRHVVFASGGGTYLVWDPTSSAWVTPSAADRPWTSRVAAAGPDLRVRFDERVPTIEVSVRLPTSGDPRWAPFAWMAGERLPFDRATSIGLVVSEGTSYVYVGTQLGVRRFAVTANEGVDHGIHDVSGAVGATPVPGVVAVGRPFEAPGGVAVATTGACGYFGGSSRFAVSCPEPSFADTFYVLDNPFWSWRRSQGGIVGTYKLASGGIWPVTDLGRGRLPHDRLASVAYCGGARFELWAGSGVTAHRGGAGEMTLVDVRELSATELRCQERASELGGGTLSPGAYLVGASTAARHVSGRWLPEEATEAAALRERIDGRVAFDSARYRLGLASGAVAEQVRSRADEWRPVRWEGGRSDLDRTVAVAAVRGGWYRMTPGGFVPVSAIEGRPWSIDPANLWVDSTVSGDLGACVADTVEVLDGSMHTVPAVDRSPVRWLCADGRRFIAEIGAATDVGAIIPLEDDPFSSRTVVAEEGTWTWTLRREDATTTSVEVEFKGALGALDGGRFAFDAFASLAAPYPGIVELVAADGWWRHPVDDFRLQAAARVPGFEAPEAVTAVYGDAGESATERSLCMVVGGVAVSVAADGTRLGTPGRCGVDAGSDGFWRLRNVASGGAMATGVDDEGRSGARVLTGGRWSDLRVVGGPVLRGDTLYVPVAGGVLNRSLVEGHGVGYEFHEETQGIVAVGEDLAILAGGAEVRRVGDDEESMACAGVGAWFAARAPGVPIRKSVVHADGTVTVWFEMDDAVHQRTFDCLAGTSRPWHVRLDVSRRARLRLSGVDVPAFQQEINVCLVGTEIVVEGLDGRSRVVGAIDHERPLVLTAVGSRSVALATERDVYVVDVDAALTMLLNSEPSPTRCGM